MADEKIIAAVKAAREGSKKRNFKQSFDIAINLKNTDLKKPENKIKADVFLPGTAAVGKVGVFADALVPQAKTHEDVIIIRKDDLEAYGKDKKAAKALANACHSFVAEAPLMPLVGRWMGQVLAVRGKMPKPVPPTIPDIRPVIDRAKATVSIAVKGSPVIHCRIGTEDMTDEKVADNAAAVMNAAMAALPKGKDQVKNVYIKLTMGKPVKIEM
ncbi:MAG: 50S ribosomal protein L1 [Candidatus Aenigmatarchaeota archaeon]